MHISTGKVKDKSKAAAREEHIVYISNPREDRLSTSLLK